MTHQPKGSMCMACTRKNLDCSFMPFHTMPPISKHLGVIVVRCTEFVQADKKGDAA